MQLFEVNVEREEKNTYRSSSPPAPLLIKFVMVLPSVCWKSTCRMQIRVSHPFRLVTIPPLPLPTPQTQKDPKKQTHLPAPHSDTPLPHLPALLEPNPPLNHPSFVLLLLNPTIHNRRHKVLRPPHLAVQARPQVRVG